MKILNLEVYLRKIRSAKKMDNVRSIFSDRGFKITFYL